ncbi:hypothetical protein [Nocardioides kongjuensis]|uniref:Uncharacterized protein n=1 Tax=Nocardioides kongjuensis TaxID=349522 RepID=A0A852RSK6_9ACTN|nr:hypothetical protein [Nocardioides kongjuensis]NYD33865.1 hypothetical protein [Nocardioides kongjuensis]
MNPEPRRATRRHEKAAAARRRRESRRGKATCGPTGKTRFPDVGAAFSAALRLSHTLGRPIRAYPCPDCAGWHLTRRRTPPKDTP